MLPCDRFHTQRGVTLLELMTVIVVIAILSLMILPLVNTVQARLERTRCATNMRSIHAATLLYMQDNNRSWPQIASVRSSDPITVANKWINTMKPYGLDQNSWVCPTLQKLMHTDLSKPENARIDYAATPFDSKPTTPYQWATQPWYIEVIDVHGNGQLIIFPDGSVRDAFDVLKPKPKP